MKLLDRITGKTEQRLAESVVRLRESSQQHADNESLLMERLADLELAIEDADWRRLSAQGDREFSRQGLQDIMRMSRLMFLKNPLVNRAVSLQAIYVWAQGVTVSSSDEKVQVVLDEFMKDEKNMVELTGHQARTMKEQDLQVLGNLYFAFFSALDTGNVVVRTIPAEEVWEIITNPEDRREAWFYKRTWMVDEFDLGSGATTSKQRTAYYPDMSYEPAEADRVPMIAGNQVMWDTPIYHVRVGGLSDMKFGVPETYQATDWARAYNSFLEDWATIVRAYARFAWKLTAAGGKAGIAAGKAKLDSTLGTAGSPERNPPSVAGSTFVTAGTADMAPIKTAGATTSAEDGRRLLLQVCAAFGFPESFFGDVSVGTLATAKSLDRPTELKFRDRQELWKSILVKILTYVVQRSRGAANGRLRVVGGKQAEAIPIDVAFPPILEHDIAEQMGAIVAGATLNGSPSASTIDDETLSRLILSALNVPNINDVLDLVAKQREENAARAEEIAAQTADTQPVAKDAQVAESLRDLVSAMDRLKGKLAA